MTSKCFCRTGRKRNGRPTDGQRTRPRRCGHEEVVHERGGQVSSGDEITVNHSLTLFSDKISLDRSIPDSRPPECLKLHFDKELPKASVVVIFTDEAWSPLIRTVHSVVNRSPAEHLLEVLLYDDFSQRGECFGCVLAFKL